MGRSKEKDGTLIYRVIIEEKASESLNRLDIKLKERINAKIEAAMANPHHFFERLMGREDYKLRVGDYRIIAEISEAESLITITMVGHRKDIYK
jgi:mRNA interferase RelE/StbE